MQCSALLRVLPLLSFLLYAAMAAEAKEAPVNASTKAAALVRQLGADSYELREAAYTELEKLGNSAQKALEEGVQDEDLEVSSRSKRLLAWVTRNEIEVALDAFLADKDSKLILKLPAWERFKKVVGEDTNARAMFVEMYTLEEKLLSNLERDPKEFEAAFNTRCQEIQKNLYTPFGQVNQIPLGQILALLFAATDPRTATDVNSAKVNSAKINVTHINSFYMITNLLYQQNIQQGFKSNAGARKLLAQFFEQRMDQNTMSQAIQLSMYLEMKEMAPVALKAATNKSSQQWTRATALLAVGQLGGKENIKDIESLLEDKTLLGTMQTINQLKVETQMRDVALASMIMLSGQDVLNYDFPYLKANRIQRNQYRSYQYFGFSDNTQREAAFKKFKESQHVKEQDK